MHLFSFQLFFASYQFYEQSIRFQNNQAKIIQQRRMQNEEDMRFCDYLHLFSIVVSCFLRTFEK